MHRFEKCSEPLQERQRFASPVGAFCVRGADLMSKDYSAEFKRRFADGNADGVAITILQHEFGLMRSQS